MSEKGVISDWSKLPVPLQHQFFKHAEDEANKCKNKLMEKATKLQEYSKFLRFEKIKENVEWEKWKVGVVDGWSSPSISERIGVKFGTYCAGYMIFAGKKIINEGYRSGKISQPQIGGAWKTAKVLGLLRDKLEREISRYCLENKGVDLLIIDGSFFGFQARCKDLREEKIDVEGYKYGEELVDDVRDVSIELVESKQTVGVIKRARTVAFDGFVLIKNGGKEEECIGMNDRGILSSIMPNNHWFAYEWLLGSAENFNFYSNVRGILHMYVKSRKRLPKNMDEILAMARDVTKIRVKNNLNCDPKEIFQTSRYYVRCEKTAPPFCFEIHRDADVKPLLAYFLDFLNPATGLPFPLDLIDENVYLPRGFTREFVEEVEAELIRDPELKGVDLSNYFMYINPQKEE